MAWRCCSPNCHRERCAAPLLGVPDPEGIGFLTCGLYAVPAQTVSCVDFWGRRGASEAERFESRQHRIFAFGNRARHAHGLAHRTQRRGDGALPNSHDMENRKDLGERKTCEVGYMEPCMVRTGALKGLAPPFPSEGDVNGSPTRTRNEPNDVRFCLVTWYGAENSRPKRTNDLVGMQSLLVQELKKVI